MSRSNRHPSTCLSAALQLPDVILGQTEAAQPLPRSLEGRTAATGLKKLFLGVEQLRRIQPKQHVPPAHGFAAGADRQFLDPTT